MRYKFLLPTCVLLCVCISASNAQMVLNALTGAPVPNASVISVSDENTGTNTAEDGSFSINVDIGAEIRISSVGFKPQNVSYEGENLIVLLERQIALIEEIVITPDEDEAARVLRLSVENRENHAPWQRDYFQCEMYNKYRVDLLKDSLQDPSKLIRMLEKRIQGETVFFSESAMTYNFQYPNRIEEHIIANKVAGFEKAQFNFLPEQLVAFDINGDFLDLLNRHYILPISNGSERHYGLHLEETKVNNGDTTWYIQFWPEKSNYDLLRGHVIINSDGYAVEEYRLTNNKKDHQKFDIYHHFRKFNDEWFPDKMFSNIVMTDLTLGISVLYDQKTYINNARFDEIKIDNVNANRIDFSEGVQDNPVWIENHRTEPLSNSDEVAIEDVGNTVDNLKLERKLDVIANLVFFRYPVGPVDLDIARFFWSNKTEGYRPGIGLITNDKFSKRVELNAFIGYGLQDDLWKYGGGMAYHLTPQKTTSLYVQYEKEVLPISSYIRIEASSNILANFYTDQIDDIEFYSAGIKGRFSNLTYDLNFKKSTSSPRYNYAFRTEDDVLLNEFRQGEFNLHLNYIKRKFVPFYTYEIELKEYHSTLVDFNLSFAPKDAFDNNVNYLRAELFVKRPINFKHFGRVELAIHTGFITGEKILNRIHIGNGSHSSGLPFQLSNSFNTMMPFTFLADQYVNIFYNHRIFRLYQMQLSAPYLHIAQHSGWGKADVLDRHTSVLLQSYSKGYHESGLILSSLIRYEVFSVMQLGLNVGAWYRWGHYATRNTKDDLVFKFGFSINF